MSVLRRIAVISRDSHIHSLAQEVAHEVFVADDLSEAGDMIETVTPDLTLFDGTVPPSHIRCFLDRIGLRIHPVPVTVVAMMDPSSFSEMEYERAGVSHYLVGMEDCRRLHEIAAGIRGAVRPGEPTDGVRHEDYFLNEYAETIAMVGKSPAVREALRMIELVADSQCNPVLILGGTGTGKEVAASAIHVRRHPQEPFVAINCAALTATLLESELFGHEKGAFTGAYTQRKGRFERAHGGTLLLDEITETPPQFQAKLLRILEQQEFERVGGSENIKINVRIISTTNRDLLSEVQMGRFRPDLYYRLSAARIVVPPLRERREDLTELVWHFVNLYAREAQRRIARLDPAMMEIFAEYPWPGNIRQLRNVVLTSLILGTGPTLSLADVSWLFDELQPLPQCDRPGRGIATAAVTADPAAGVGGIPLADLERKAILETLRQTSGNQTKAAKVLGISDRTLREKMRRYRQQECLQPVS